jgi:oligopeptide/dipeptide ABC transporter ATP-binding protein
MLTETIQKQQTLPILLETKKLKKQFTLSHGFFNTSHRRISAVDQVDLSIFQGETLGLVGESGCGKSTLARMIMRLEQPDSGSVYFKDKNIYSYDTKELKEYRRHIQMIFQDPYSSLNPRKSAFSIIKEPLIIHKMDNKNDTDEYVKQLMKKVGLSQEQASRYPHEFSGGQRQRIGIARALALNPELIVADEPVSALDASIQAQILNLLKNLKRDLGLTFLFISHDLNVIRHVSDRIAVMYLGKIVELAGKEHIYNQPLHPYTRLLLSVAPSLDGRKKHKRIPIIGEADSNVEMGCRFKSRCSYKIDLCSKTEPSFQEYTERRFCACHRAGEI